MSAPVRWPRRRQATRAGWLALKLGCSRDEAEQRLLASQHAAWRMTATPSELRAEAEYQATLAPTTGVRVVVDGDVADAGNWRSPRASRGRRWRMSADATCPHCRRSADAAMRAHDDARAALDVLLSGGEVGG